MSGAVVLVVLTVGLLVLLAAGARSRRASGDVGPSVMLVQDSTVVPPAPRYRWRGSAGRP